MRNRRLREKHSRPRERRCKDPQTRGFLRARGVSKEAGGAGDVARGFGGDGKGFG